MKKIVSMLLLQILVLCLAFAATTNSKQGYFKLAWGSSVEDAKKAGYKLTSMGADYSDKLYAVHVDAYKVTAKDKSVSALQFHYYMGSLFLVTETLTGYTLDPQKLAGRYGDFNQRGIFRSGKQYTDAKFGLDGSVLSMSIVIANNSAGNVVTTQYDWNIYSVISFAGQKLAHKGQSLSIGAKNSIAEELTDMANDLTKSVEGDKPKFAFLPLTTDYNNVLTEDYVTDELSVAMFNTGKISIVERANLEAVLNEQKFQASGLVDERTAKSIGMLAGAAFVCYGTIRDLGDRLTINARVIDVETGELFAISRATVKKDDYLKQRKQGAEGERKSSRTATTKTTTSAPTPAAPAPAKTAASTPAKTTTAASNSAWKVTKYRDEFEGYTKYIFRAYSVDEKFVFISYKKCDVEANSRVIAGVGGWVWDYFDIKSKEGTVSKYFKDTWKEYLDASQRNGFEFAWNHSEGARFLVERCKNNEFITLRRNYDKVVRRFQTAGLLDKMAEYGITWAEIDAAIANEEF